MTLLIVIALTVLFVSMGILYLKQQPNKVVSITPVAKKYLGKVYTLEYPVINGTGILQLDDMTWRINCVDLPAGARIKIINTNGLILLAEPNQA